MKILLVDDSIIVRTILQNTLNDHENAEDFTFLTAGNGRLALDMLRKNEINIMFLDWNMPIMTGEELIDKMREDKRLNKVRIIMATTEDGKDSVVKMAKKGVNGYLIKPFEPEAVMKAFNTVYSRIRTTR